MAALTFVFVAVAIVLAVTLAWALVTLRRRHLVRGSSDALKRLEELNLRSQSLIPSTAPIHHSYSVSVNTKAKFDRFDLSSRMSVNVLESELWYLQEIETRLVPTRQFRRYTHDVEAIEFGSLGRSSHRRLSDARFAAIEKKDFNRRKLAYPTPTAKVTTTVKYTSPKGQNSYSRHVNWNFEQLQQGLDAAQASRARQSTTAALRQRERSLMTSGLRVTILRRDDYRCRMCGASAADGAVLHIDHITPVSRDGLTVPENLQTLCESCNLGKSNRFIG
ncbi:HNH endonuclease [Cryobacterium sp. TMT4-31]|uniref:HNH endonuclease n=1 Tax=Cryobacterium sp. TMT4-31 TaxID=1259259 RepID=UPI00141B8E1F|nr:HNH endonuclease signature motif containing protein [Cryobacterium sp. TMT4-31]